MQEITTEDPSIIKKNPDKAGEEYWTKVWENTPLPPPFRFDTSKLNDYPNKVLHKIFKQILGDTDYSNKKFLEIGCGNSVFLSYFAKEFGFDIYGIDYSRYGCEQTRKILQRDNLKGTIIEADAFNPPKELLNSFDVVCSLGVAEHFEDTAATLKSFAAFLKPGGILITEVPNFSGATGYLHKWLNKSVYDIHVPMDKDYLANSIKKAGLEIFLNKYFLSISFAITLEGIDGKKIPYFTIKKIFIKSIRYFSKIIWLIEQLVGELPARKLFSAGIVSAAKKPLK